LGIGLIHLLAGVAAWRGRPWGWWLGLALFVIPFVAELWLTQNSIEHLNDRFGTTPDAVAAYGVGAVLYGIGVWAVASSRAWFTRPR
jgi:hypothetical protein